MFRAIQKFIWSLRSDKWRREQEQIGFDSVDESWKPSAKQISNDPTPDHWYKKPIPVIGIAVTSGLIIYFITHFVLPRLGIS